MITQRRFKILKTAKRTHKKLRFQNHYFFPLNSKDCCKLPLCLVTNSEIRAQIIHNKTSLSVQRSLNKNPPVPNKSLGAYSRSKSWSPYLGGGPRSRRSRSELANFKGEPNRATSNLSRASLANTFSISSSSTCTASVPWPSTLNNRHDQPPQSPCQKCVQPRNGRSTPRSDRCDLELALP